ncbi:spermatogenesis-associated protein 31A6-like [Pipistrellus kuhlii]|uniref:spermatogenesis-associated protein 31A6-like n=1 Tax=Pipistrellus kuhlii TaxID=59472 RepID=UPI00174EE55D|nr:spermatogenesis-associated protein 31A6-like [Pipistrellus kuhlii]
MSSLASLAPVTECPLPPASTLSPGPTNFSVPLHSHSPLSASRTPEPFLLLDDLSPQPLALSCSPSLPPDSGAHPPAPTASSASPPPASTLTLPHCDSVALTLGPVPQSSCPHTPRSASPSPVQLQATASPLLSHPQPMSPLAFPSPPWLPTVPQLPPPLAQVQTRCSLPALPPSSPPQIGSCGVSCLTARNESQFLIPIEIPHPERPLLQKQVESGWDLSSVVKRSQEVFSVFTSNCPKDSILPENFPINPESQKQLEPHLQNWHMQHSWELSPKIQEPPKPGQHQSELPDTCQAEDKHESSQPSSHTGESSNDTQNVGLQLSHVTEKVPKELSRGSESSLVTFQRVDSEESESDVILLRKDCGSDLLRNLDKNLENTLKGHSGSKLGQRSKSLMSVHGRWLAVRHSSAKADTHMETKNLGILKDWEPCMNASHGVVFLDTDVQKVLEAHITKFWVKHRWGLPLKVLKPMHLVKLKRAQTSPIPHSSTCVSGAFSIDKIIEFPEKPLSQACPGDKVKTDDSVPTLAKSLLASSRVCEEMQSALGRTPPGVGHGPSKASLTRQEGRPPSQSVSLTWKNE